MTHPDEWWGKWSDRLPRMLAVPLQSRFIRFLLVGGLNTLFGYCLFAVLILLAVPYPLAVLLSTVAGILFNFRTYGTLVFGTHDKRLLLRFFAVYAVCYGLNLLPLEWAERNGYSLLITGALIALPMALIAYTLNRLFVFRRSESR